MGGWDMSSWDVVGWNAGGWDVGGWMRRCCVGFMLLAICAVAQGGDVAQAGDDVASGRVMPASATQENALPSADSVLDKYVWSTGGTQGWARQRDRIAKYALNIVDMDVRVDITEYAKAPNLSYREFKSKGTQGWADGFDGTLCWETHPANGPRIKSGDERTYEIRRSSFHQPLMWRDLYESTEMAGVGQIEQYQCYQIRLTPPEGDPDVWHIEKDTYLLRGLETTVPTISGPVQVKAILEDYREVGGILYAHKIRQQVFIRKDARNVVIRKMTIELQSIQQNTGIPDSRFTPPKTILDLVKE